jgi:hypothetical protein
VVWSDEKERIGTLLDFACERPWIVVKMGLMTVRAVEMADSDQIEWYAIWERLTRPIPDGSIAGDRADWDSIIFEIAEALGPDGLRTPGRHARRGAR